MSKHTKGPWVSETEEDGAFNITGRGGHRQREYYVICSRSPHDLTEETHANAHLIAAAPELLEALEAMVLFSPHTKSNAAALNAAISAIAKARGEA